MTAYSHERPGVSVVLPTHNRAGLLGRAIESVLKQSFRDFELIVVDDASVDETEQVVAGFDEPRIRYVRHSAQKGAPAARNTGIRAVRAKVVAFQDSDDEWHPEKLAKQMDVLKASGNREAVIYTGFLRHSADSSVYIPEPWVAHRDGDILSQLLLGNFVSTQTLLLPCTYLDAVGGFDERLRRFQDWELVIRLAKAYHFRLVDEPLVLAHETPGNISSNEAAGFSALEIILDKHRSEFKQCPAVLADHFLNLGYFNCRNGEKAKGRGFFMAALRLRPWSTAAWKSSVLALLRSWTYR